jgi:hypothetical protein
MEVIEKNPLRLTRAGVVMAVWGLLLLGAGIYNQYQFPSVEAIVFLWGAVTVIGLVAQAVCEIQHQPVNFYVWLACLVVAWAFTHYTLMWDNGAHMGLYGDLAGVWLIFLGVGYIDTARKINTRFLWVGVVHVVAGILLELSARGIVKVDLLSNYSTLIFGIVAGGTLLIAAVMARIQVETPQADSALPSQSPA